MALGQTLAGLLPVLGTGIGSGFGPGGAALGGALGTFGGQLAGNYFGQQSPADQARAQLLQQLQGAAPYQRVDFDPIAQEEMRRYRQEVVPSIANQFAGADALRSSGFRQALSGAGQDLQTRLAALRSQHELGQQSLLGGAEERRRNMLAGLTGGMIGEQQQQEMNRQNMLQNILGNVPSYMIANAGLQNQRQQGVLGQLLAALGGQQNIQQGNVAQAVNASQPILDRAFENLIRQDPTRGEQILNYILQGLGTAGQVAGTAARAALL